MVEETTDSISLSADLSSVPAARHFVMEALGRSQSPELRDAAALCVTELVANVIRHTRSRSCLLTVASSDGGVRIEVHDESSDPPAVQGQADGEKGRGLRIVEALARAWGVEHYDGDGKAVWVCLA